MPTYARAPVEFVRGEGAGSGTRTGSEYLDFFAGLSVHNAGHCHPRIVAAITRAGRATGGRLEPLLHGAGDASLRAARRVEPRRAACSCATRAPRPTSARSSWSESTPTRVGSRLRRSSSSTARSTGARSARWRRRRGSRATISSAHCRRATSRCPATIPRRSASGGRRADRRGPGRADPGRGGRLL